MNLVCHGEKQDTQGGGQGGGGGGGGAQEAPALVIPKAQPNISIFLTQLGYKNKTFCFP